MIWLRYFAYTISSSPWTYPSSGRYSLAVVAVHLLKLCCSLCCRPEYLQHAFFILLCKIQETYFLLHTIYDWFASQHWAGEIAPISHLPCSVLDQLPWLWNGALTPWSICLASCTTCMGMDLPYVIFNCNMNEIQGIWIVKSIAFICYYTPHNEVRGVYWIHPVCLSVCSSVRPSVLPSVRPSICSTVLPLVSGIVTRQKSQINGSVVLGTDESPWPCGTPSWYTPLSWMILSKQKDLHLFSSQYVCVFSCDQAALWMVFSVRLSICPSVRLSICLSVCPSVRLSHLFDYVPIIVSSWNFQELSHWTRVRSMQKVKVRGQSSRSQRSRPKFSFPDCNSSLNSHMMMKWYI